MKYVKRSGSRNIRSVAGRIDQPRVVLTTTSSYGMVGPPRGSCSLAAPAAHPLPQVHRSSEPWTHTLARVCGDSRAAVNHNSTTCESARAQVRPKITSSYHCLEESRFAIQKSPVGSTPIGDYSVVRALRVWMVATSTAFGSRYPWPGSSSKATKAR